MTPPVMRVLYNRHYVRKGKQPFFRKFSSRRGNYVTTVTGNYHIKTGDVKRCPCFANQSQTHAQPIRAARKIAAMMMPMKRLRRSLMAKDTGSPSTSPRRAIIQMRLSQ